MAAQRRVAIGLGSNLGDREGCIRAAAALLAAGGLEAARLSALHHTAPVGCAPAAPEFINAALTATTTLPPTALLALCRDVERQLGRPPRRRRQDGPYANRTIDLDLLLVDELTLATPALVLPHPRLRERAFVLRPLAELAPDWPVPPDRRTVADCLAALVAREPSAP